MDNQVRNIAPFIDDRFLITSKWWNERVNPVTGETEIHRGLDIATSGSKRLYSILDGVVHSRYTDSDGALILVIKDDNETSPTYGYATMYVHMANYAPDILVGTRVTKGQYVGDEGQTGQATGIHLHLEMQDLNRWNNVWHWSYNKDDYLDPTVYMGIDNIQGTWWIYNGDVPPTPPTPTTKKKKFPWFIINRKRRWRK